MAVLTGWDEAMTMPLGHGDTDALCHRDADIMCSFSNDDVHIADLDDLEEYLNAKLKTHQKQALYNMYSN